jgi:hypothetical protein
MNLEAIGLEENDSAGIQVCLSLSLARSLGQALKASYTSSLRPHALYAGTEGDIGEARGIKLLAYEALSY